MDAKTSTEIHEYNVLYGCCTTPGKMVVAGGSGLKRVTFSYNGLTWYSSPSGNALFGDLGVCHTVAYDGKMWVIGGQGANRLGYSTDGQFWTPAPTASQNIFGTGNCFTVATNGSLWLAGGQSSLSNGTQLAYSTDGINWNAIASKPFSTTCNSIVWNGLLWVAGGNGSTPLAWSTDPLNVWNSVSNPFGGTPNCHAVYFNGEKWLAGANNVGGTIILATSPDGKAWTALSSPVGVGTECHTISANTSQWLIGVTGAGLMYSADGTTFTTATTLFVAGQCLSLVWTGSYWLAGGDDLASNKLIYSKDGMNWVNSNNGNSLFQTFTSGSGNIQGSVRALATNNRPIVKPPPKFNSHTEYIEWRRLNAQIYNNTTPPCIC